MKKAIMVTSVIDINNNYPLTYSKVRSYFNNEDRLRHTIFTISSLDHIIDDDTIIFLLDASDNSEKYANLFRYQRNLKYVDVAKEFPNVFEKIRTHPHKSHCEMILQESFLKKYENVLKEFDFIFKVSGRYFFDHHFNLNHCLEEHTDKIFFKKHLEYDWNNNWGYNGGPADRRDIQQDNKLRQYSTVAYCWGREKYDQMLDIFRVIGDLTDNKNYMHYDVETLIYAFTRHYESDIIETNWVVYGWTGVNGNFVRY